MHEGHAYAGCWLEEKSLPETSTDDLQHIRKLSTDELVTVFECTLVTNESPGTLKDAELLAQPHLQTSKPFRIALDIYRSRLARIKPLPLPNQFGAMAAGDIGKPEMVAGIGEREFIESTPIANEPAARPATRIDQWKSRLLDLSLRNRLLNFKETKSAIRILSSKPESVEDELAAERELALRPKPKLMGDDDPRSAIAYTQQERSDAFKDHLVDELKHGRLHTNLEENEHARRCTDLFRSARTAIEENGTNTLFAAVGILEWREAEHSDRIFRAPLLLVPVEIKRKSVVEGFSLHRIDEETRLNFTLMEMLRQHFRKEIPGLDPLPEDDSGVDVGLVFRVFREAVRDMPGWEVKTEVWVAQFSFTKFLLWKDLADRLEDLTRNRIVHHLVNEAGTPYPHLSTDIRPEQLDQDFHPREIFCPRSADSSQLAAVMAAAAGHDFVLEGPPGTGKSQTITNIISHCLAQGKKVLFVAEKRAALDVVYRRLREEGLEPFCLELHSNKSGKADVVAQLDRSLKFITDSSGIDWEHRSGELEKLRDSLNAYTSALHRRHPCGLSAYQCLDYLLPRRNEPIISLTAWSSILSTQLETLERAREVAKLLQQRSNPLLPLGNHTLSPLACQDWSPVWAESSLEHIRELGKINQTATTTVKELRDWLHFPKSGLSKTDLANLLALVESLLASEPVGAAFATTPWNQLCSNLDAWIPLLIEKAQLRANLLLIHGPRIEEAKSVACEDWTQTEAEQIFERSRQLEAVTQQAKGASADLLKWLQFPRPAMSRQEMVQLVTLVDSLLALAPVGENFATAVYRSRHESLITFSNRQYYDNELLTFPSAETKLGGVRFRHLPNARYDKGKSRTNRGEAEALVNELVKRLRDEKTPRRSYGVVTFSLAQQQLVENLLDEERRKYPEIEFHFGDEPPVEGEPVFVKNLENVQGDERDVILFSICYGIDESGRTSMNFGPLNRDGGERRLNVAITRAKYEVLVFSGLRADQIDLTRTRARGVRDLKYFLDYAERGPGALSSANFATADGEPESEFEQLVAKRLRIAGHEVHHQVGCSGYRIDLGILDPSNPGRYQLGIECDGATYHRAATARDRDKLRQAILEGLGWKLYRIWSTDWWHDSEAEIQKLCKFIEELPKS